LNKQRFLAELSRLLVYMTEGDRELTMRRYTEMFDAAGEEGEQDLIKSLGTPTKVAISLSRGYEPGKATELFNNLQVQNQQQKSGHLPEIPWEDVPEFTLPDNFGPATPEKAPDGFEPAAPDKPEGKSEKPKPKGPESEELGPEEHDQQEQPQAPARQPVKRPMPLYAGIPLFVLAAIVVGLPLAAVVLTVILALLSPGAAAVGAAGLVTIGALWCINYIADALLMFGLAFLVLAVALVLLWAGVWCDIKLVGAVVHLVRAFAGAVLGKREA